MGLRLGTTDDKTTTAEQPPATINQVRMYTTLPVIFSVYIVSGICIECHLCGCRAESDSDTNSTHDNRQKVEC